MLCIASAWFLQGYPEGKPGCGGGRDPSADPGLSVEREELVRIELTSLQDRAESLRQQRLAAAAAQGSLSGDRCHF